QQRLLRTARQGRGTCESKPAETPTVSAAGLRAQGEQSEARECEVSGGSCSPNAAVSPPPPPPPPPPTHTHTSPLLVMERRHGPRPAQIWPEWHRMLAARTGLRPPATASIYFFLCRRQNQLAHRARIRLAPLGEPPPRGSMVGPSSPPLCSSPRCGSATPSRSTSSLTCTISSVSPTSPTCSLPTHSSSLGSRASSSVSAAASA
ncbi:unnamed protein product, partial [Urochloa humidicola]